MTTRKDIQVVFNGWNTLIFDLPLSLTYMNPNAFSLIFYLDDGTTETYDLISLGYTLDPLNRKVKFSFTDTSNNKVPGRYKLRFRQALDSYPHDIAIGAIQWQ